jgi:sec-independent protein translocase protein TatC
VSFVGRFARLYSTKPANPVGPDGRMALGDHLREARARVLRAGTLMVIVLGVAIYFFEPLYDVVVGPYTQARERLPDGTTEATTAGAAGGLMLYLKLAGFTALVATAPYWLYQVWAFILPGLHAAERKWSRVFVAIAGPLFLFGIALGYFTLPKGLEVLIGLNPEGVTNLVDFNEYLQFFTRTLFVFGLAFEIPVFVVMLNLAGVVSGKTLGAHRPWIIVGMFVFAAVATPSADPFTMTFMAVPMVLLYFISEIIARWNDRRKAARNLNASLSPDELSPI